MHNDEDTKRFAIIKVELEKSRREYIQSTMKDKFFSGHISLRLNPEVHRKLAIEAKLNHTNLNAVIQNKIDCILRIEDYLKEELAND